MEAVDAMSWLEIAFVFAPLLAVDRFIPNEYGLVKASVFRSSIAGALIFLLFT